MEKKEPSLSDMISVACVGTVAFLALMTFQYWPNISNELLKRNEELVNQNIELVKENHKLTNEIKLTNEFKKVLADIKPEEYVLGENDCYDYSKRLQKALKDIGIESSIAIREDRGHAWVLVWIEATDGNFISPNVGWDILEIRDHNMYVLVN